ncbi:MAG: hypothetical protein RR220_07050 [Bacteroidaceae bacterium]
MVFRNRTFSFGLNQKRKIPKRKVQDFIFSATSLRIEAKENELASLKQHFLFNASVLRSALRSENKVSFFQMLGSIRFALLNDCSLRFAVWLGCGFVTCSIAL